MAHALLSCPQVRELDLTACHKLSDAGIRSAATTCPLLASLNISSCLCVTDVTLREIAAACPNLCILDASYWPNVTFESVRLPMLVDLKLNTCEGITSVSMSALSYSCMLEALWLDNCGLLTSISLDLPHLRSISLVHLHKFYLSSFCGGGGCPMLRSLVLDNCERLSAIELKNRSLVSLSLAGCHAMTFLDLSCLNLQKINLGGCNHLVIASFCPVGLECLNLGICPKLTVLSIEAPGMSLLELKGCGVLSQASIRCPSLTSLDASFCRKLNDGSLSTTAASCLRIESLILPSCLSIGFDGLSSLHQLLCLTLLDLSYMFLMNLHPVFDTCSQLMILKLSACKFLTDSSLDALYKKSALPALHELDLSYSSIGQSAITAVLASCTNLVHVNLNGCVNMHELVWGSGDYSSSDVAVDTFSSSLTLVRNDN